MKTYKSIFIESIESEKFIEQIAKIWLNLLSKEIGPRIKEEELNSEEYNQYYMDNGTIHPNIGILGVTYLESNDRPDTKNSTLDYFFSHIENSFRLFLLAGGDRKKAIGTYDSKGKRINLYINDSVELARLLSMSDKEINTFKWEIWLINRFYKTVVHELTHAYDDFMSGGKYISNDYVGIDGGDAYYNQTLEYNAYYTAAVSEIRKYRYFTWESYIDKFKDSMYSFKKLNKEYQKKILKRLYAEWSLPITSPEEIKKIYNDRFFKSIHYLQNGDIDKMKVITSESRVKNFNLIKYGRQVMEDLFTKKVSEKEFNSISIEDSPYRAIKDFVEDFTTDKLKTIYDALHAAKESGDFERMDFIQGILDEQMEKLKNKNMNMVVGIEKFYGINKDKLYTIIDNYSGVA
jgi:ferritin